MSKDTLVIILVLGGLAITVNAWLWQYNINTFRGRNREGVGFLPCLLLSFIPALGQIAFPLAIFCFIFRLIEGDSANESGNRGSDYREEESGGTDGYVLDIGGSSKIRNPSAEKIRNAVFSMANDSFLILFRNDIGFMQVAGDQQSGFDFEFQEGDVNQHYRAKRSLTADEVVEAMSIYITGSMDWKKIADWEWMEIK